MTEDEEENAVVSSNKMKHGVQNIGHTTAHTNQKPAKEDDYPTIDNAIWCNRNSNNSHGTGAFDINSY